MRVQFQQLLDTFTTDEHFVDAIKTVMGMPEKMPRAELRGVGLDGPPVR